MSKFLSELNEKQSEAVLSLEGPVLVIAGAGSGKTKTITHRIAYLTEEKKIDPTQILAVTFTNKAADEMKNRVAKLLSYDLGSEKKFLRKQWNGFGFGPVIGTFHSLCARILRQEAENIGFSKSFAIYDSEDQKSAIKKVMYNNGVSPKEVNPNAVLSAISRAKNELISPESFSLESDGFFAETVAGLYQSYIEYLKENQAMDFDDLLLHAVSLFKDNPKILAKYHKTWEYVMVDEYQDTNHAQYLLSKMLAEKSKNLFVVGDDWQGIYSWRGANIRNILEFEKDYKGAKVILLEQNYRSTAPIVALGNAIISGNNSQTKKKLWTNRAEGELPEVWQVLDESMEADFILEKISEIEGILGSNPRSSLSPKKDLDKSEDIEYDYEAEGGCGGGILDKIMKGFREGRKKYKGSGSSFSISSRIPFDIGKRKIKWNDYVVLYRTNAQSRVIEEAFLKYGVPYRLIGGIRFYDRKEIKDTIAYIRFLLNQNDVLALERVVNEPARGIGNKTMERIYLAARESGSTMSDLVLEIDELEGVSALRLGLFKEFMGVFVKAREKMADFTVSETIDFLLKHSGYIDSIKSEGVEGTERLENILELKSVAKKFSNLRGEEALQAFLEDVALVSDQDTYDPSKGEAITLMTLHSAKGLEFKNVFMVGLEEGLLPHSNSLTDPSQIEEERRLCYVGVTRAKDRLFMTLTRSRTIYGSSMTSTPSRFIVEFGSDNVSFHEQE